MTARCDAGALSINYVGVTAKSVGHVHGITPDEFSEIAERVAQEHTALVTQRTQGVVGFYDLYKDEATIARIEETAQRFLARGYENLVVLGIGGSALGIRALHTALGVPYHNWRTRAGRKGYPRLFVMDNIDPETFAAMLRLCDPKRTLYTVISKSGETAETMAQTLIVLDGLLKKIGGEGVREHLVVITSPLDDPERRSLLHPLVNEYGLTAFSIPPNVGGRFSVFSPVGLFPSAMLGLNVRALMEGCAVMDAATQSPHLQQNPAYLFAAVHYLMDARKQKRIAVMMPYRDGLIDVADWFRQLWAESLGKRYSVTGHEVFVGQTPVKALGVTDQHSQIQLYREGPNDKVITVIDTKRTGKRLRIPNLLENIPELEYLRGGTLNHLLHAEMVGTVQALLQSQRPVLQITLDAVHESSVAQLLYMLEVATAMAGRLYRINAFDQPGVEEGKRLARELMLKLRR